MPIVQRGVCEPVSEGSGEERLVGGCVKTHAFVGLEGAVADFVDALCARQLLSCALMEQRC